MIAQWKVLTSAAIIAFGASAAFAEDAPTAPAPDKSQYDLFNPAPSDQMRSFCSDRPTKSSSPCTVDAGHFQYESDIFNWTHQSANGVVQNTYLYTNPTFKLGVNNRIDVELNIAPVEEVNTHDKAAHTTADLTGVGDLYARVKYNLFGNDSGDIAASLFPYVKIPTAAPGIGNKAFEEGLILPVSFNLPYALGLTLNPEIDILQNADGTGYHSNFQGAVSLSRTVFTDITGSVEIWSDANEDPQGTSTQWSLDFSLAWLLLPELQFDVGANMGLNNATPDLQSYVGISQRF